MRSQHADRFNHDDVAFEYDDDVRDESNPIRAGYAELLSWVAESCSDLCAAATEGSRVLELGVGTGNLTRLLVCADEIVCVDVSDEMLKIARAKLETSDLGDRLSFVNADLLEIFEHESMSRGFDAVISTYTIHHLTEEERALFFERVAEVLRPGGGYAFGDLAFEGDEAEREILAGYRRQGLIQLAEEIEDEFFWNLEISERNLLAAGFDVEMKRFSELTWGLRGRKR